MVDVNVLNFQSNNSRNLSDIITNIKVGKTKEGLTLLAFNTADKYCDISVSTYNSDDGDFVVFTIQAIIWEDGANQPLDEIDLDRYFSHDDYFVVELAVPHDTYASTIVTPLRHEYLCTIVPDEFIHGRIDCLRDANVVWLDD